MARRDFRTGPKTPAPHGRKSGRGSLMILVTGMALGAGLTLAITHWLSAEPADEAPAPMAKTPAAKHRSPPKPIPTPAESISPSPKAPAPRAAPITPPASAAVRTPVTTAPPIKPPPKSDGFTDIYTQGKTPTITPAPKRREIFWLQVAALRKEEDARRLRARLLLLNLDVLITPSDDGTTYRVRVGPYKTEALARESEGLLNRNNLTPRLIKEPVFP